MYVLSGMLMAVSTAWAQEDQPPLVADPVALESQAAAEAIIQRDEALGRPFDPEPRAWIKGALSTLSPSELAALPVGDSPSILGDSAADLVFTPVPPCRVISFAPIPVLPAHADFVVAGLCGIPFPGPTAVAMNLVAVGATGTGDFRAWPFGSPTPFASVINYAFVPGLNIANGLVLPICNANLPGNPCTPADISVAADGVGATLVGDVYGYFQTQRPLFAVVNSAGGIVRASGATGAIHITTGQYEVDLVRDVTSCGCKATIGATGSSGSEVPSFITCQGRFLKANGLFLTTFDSAATSANRSFSVEVACPRLPVAGP
jgi:hypothetical protein